MNITMTEWSETEDRIAAELARRWPWLAPQRGIRDKLCVEAPVLKAGAELDWNFKAGNATVRTMVHSSACISGNVVDIAEAARQIAEVRDALLFISGLVAGIVVWQDGQCPCNYCGGKGKSQGSTCQRCNGKGIR